MGNEEILRHVEKLCEDISFDRDSSPSPLLTPKKRHEVALLGSIGTNGGSSMTAGGLPVNARSHRNKR